jgi:hypothetical protein
MFQPLAGIFEPSAIQQLPDGRLLVAEDEQDHPFSLVTLTSAGVRCEPLQPGWFEFDAAFWKLDDLEGLTLDRAGRVLAITSHSRDSDGDEKKSREKLVRFRIDGNRVEAKQVARGLKPALLAAYPQLAAAAELRAVKTQGGLNIEAIEFCPDSGRLWLGLRSPLQDGKAILVGVDNPDALFEDPSPRLARDLVTLDLEGNGLRGMAWIEALNGYLLIAGPVAREQRHFQLWFWRGQPDQPARRVSLPGQDGFAHAEGLCAAHIDGRSYIVVVSDDGSRKQGRSASYLLLEPAQLIIDD